uniref:Ecob115 n=1 Tax=Ectropis obliqua nucleopolyhedrovirus TaxID=59376 RepID=A0A8F2T9K6_9ABAC|nr:Ecob115 [Ectropis obliqua nucleopolyhedrovirus]UYO72911.1 Ecob115 [Ectropis obliqua nucleopolyhedrovirus]
MKNNGDCNDNGQRRGSRTSARLNTIKKVNYRERCASKKSGNEKVLQQQFANYIVNLPKIKRCLKYDVTAFAQLKSNRPITSVNRARIIVNYFLKRCLNSSKMSSMKLYNITDFVKCAMQTEFWDEGLFLWFKMACVPKDKWNNVIVKNEIGKIIMYIMAYVWKNVQWYGVTKNFRYFLYLIFKCMFANMDSGINQYYVLQIIKAMLNKITPANRDSEQYLSSYVCHCVIALQNVLIRNLHVLVYTPVLLKNIINLLLTKKVKIFNNIANMIIQMCTSVIEYGDRLPMYDKFVLQYDYSVPDDLHDEKICRDTIVLINYYQGVYETDAKVKNYKKYLMENINAKKQRWLTFDPNESRVSMENVIADDYDKLAATN